MQPCSFDKAGSHTRVCLRKSIWNICFSTWTCNRIATVLILVRIADCTVCGIVFPAQEKCEPTKLSEWHPPVRTQTILFLVHTTPLLKTGHPKTYNGLPNHEQSLRGTIHLFRSIPSLYRFQRSSCHRKLPSSSFFHYSPTLPVSYPYIPGQSTSPSSSACSVSMSENSLRSSSVPSVHSVVHSAAAFSIAPASAARDDRLPILSGGR